MTRLALSLAIFLSLTGCAHGQDQAPTAAIPGFTTDTSKRTIDLDELQNGGPGKDGIPALGLDGRAPTLTTQDSAAAWLAGREPVILVRRSGPTGDATRIYPIQILIWHEVVNDTLGGTPLAVFHSDGATTALGDAAIADGRQVGTTGAFDRRLRHDRSTYTLTFTATDGSIRDVETGSTWSVAGLATGGPLAGARLRPIQSHDTFAFAWLAFRPETTVWRAD